ncbi:MAG: N-acetyltransferase [Epsilonproteobacteria bacterium]|nr:N-acetyltransferase [Campylobacterota bacterium]
MSIKYIKPTLLDIQDMQELVRPEVEEGIILPRSDDEIATNIRSYFLAKEEDKLVGFTALHIHSPNLAEIRSLIVDKNYRGRGIGKALVREAVKEAKKLKVKKLFTLTYQKEFFEKEGFKEIAKESLPEHKIWADCIKCKHFPICNEIALIKEL